MFSFLPLIIGRIKMHKKNMEFSLKNEKKTLLCEKNGLMVKMGEKFLPKGNAA